MYRYDTRGNIIIDKTDVNPLTTFAKEKSAILIKEDPIGEGGSSVAPIKKSKSSRRKTTIL